PFFGAYPSTSCPIRHLPSGDIEPTGCRRRYHRDTIERPLGGASDELTVAGGGLVEVEDGAFALAMQLRPETRRGHRIARHEHAAGLPRGWNTAQLQELRGAI